MNRERIIELAKEAGFNVENDDLNPYASAMFKIIVLGKVERFANLVAAETREECARVCLQENHDGVPLYGVQGTECAAAIRGLT